MNEGMCAGHSAVASIVCSACVVISMPAKPLHYHLLVMYANLVMLGFCVYRMLEC